jgi:shikimate kinase
MLAGRSREEILALYRSRLPFYAQADLAVSTDGRGADQVAAEVLAALRTRERAASA